jgi:hypothetical protein
LPQGHLAYFISDAIDSRDLRTFYARYEGGGSRNQPFHPAMMVKVLVYAYAIGVCGGRYEREFGVPEDKAQDNFTDPTAASCSARAAASTAATTRRRPWTMRRTSSWRPS